MDNKSIDINLYDYPLTDERIAKYPLEDRAASKLLVYKGGEIVQSRFGNVGEYLPKGSMLVFNNTRVVRARLIMHKASGARIEIFCLEPHAPADYERAFAVRGAAEWSCIVGNLKKWKEGGGRHRLPLRRLRPQAFGQDRRARQQGTYRAFRMECRHDLRAAARTSRTHPHTAVSQPRESGDRQHALPDRILAYRRVGRRTDGGSALYRRVDRPVAGARHRDR